MNTEQLKTAMEKIIKKSGLKPEIFQVVWGDGINQIIVVINDTPLTNAINEENAQKFLDNFQLWIDKQVEKSTQIL